MGSTSRSTNVPVVPAAAPDWRAAGLRYYTLSFFYGKRFGCRVHKIPVDGGFGCPNRDGTLGWGGCIFCDPASFSPARRGPRLTIARQIAAASDRLRHRYRAERFVAYFQPGTNTYAPVDRLRAAYEEAVAQPGVVGLSVGTRPDCVPDQVLDLLAGFGRRTWVSIEYGLQTIHRRTLARINRGHGYECFADAVARSRARGLAVGAHVILGLPGETPDDMAATARQLGRLEIDLVKIHNLHAVRGTRLADMVGRPDCRSFRSTRAGRSIFWRTSGPAASSIGLAATSRRSISSDRRGAAIRRRCGRPSRPSSSGAIPGRAAGRLFSRRARRVRIIRRTAVTFVPQQMRCNDRSTPERTGWSPAGTPRADTSARSRLPAGGKSGLRRTR
jgi:radical SAM protein (TIGR01212 family)